MTVDQSQRGLSAYSQAKGAHVHVRLVTAHSARIREVRDVYNRCDAISAWRARVQSCVRLVTSEQVGRGGPLQQRGGLQHRRG